LKLGKKAISVLKGKNFAFIGTINEDGSPHVSPVWVETDGRNVLVNTRLGRVKEKNARRDPRIAVAVVDAANPYYAVVLDGRVKKAIKGKEADQNIHTLSLKYTGKRYSESDAVKRVILVIEPTKIRQQ
jgi:PPOX class probable F420-dependent enzyme